MSQAEALGESPSARQLVPPTLPPQSVYTSCYCEENIYLLARTFSAQSEANDRWPWDVYVVFISNAGKTVALWSQKAREPGSIVVWDYHVVLVLRPRRRQRQARYSGTEARASGPAASSWVYDFDTRLPLPCKWTGYVCGTFPYAFDDVLANDLDTAYQSQFRVISAAAYLDYFASDRSHMLKNGSDDEARYTKDPPPYPALCGRKARELGITHNLMLSYVNMCLSPLHTSQQGVAAEETEPYGVVVDLTSLAHWLSGEGLVRLPDTSLHQD